MVSKVGLEWQYIAALQLIIRIVTSVWFLSYCVTFFKISMINIHCTLKQYSEGACLHFFSYYQKTLRSKDKSSRSWKTYFYHHVLSQVLRVLNTRPYTEPQYLQEDIVDLWISCKYILKCVPWTATKISQLLRVTLLSNSVVSNYKTLIITRTDDAFVHRIFSIHFLLMFCWVHPWVNLSEIHILRHCISKNIFCFHTSCLLRLSIEF